MLSDEVIEKLTERLASRLEEVNLYVLRKIAKKLKEVKDLSPSDMHKLVKIMEYGGDYDKIVKKIEKITKINVEEIYAIFKETSKQDYEDAKKFYEYRKKKYIPYDENIALQNEVNAIASQTAEKYINFSNTRGIGFSIRDRDNNLVFRNLSDTFKDSIDKAILSIQQGKSSYNEEIYSIMKQIGTSGLKYMDYASGTSRRLDSAIKMAVKDGLRQLAIENQMRFGKEFDADGVEISVHSYPAPDHEEVQGRQFTNEEFEKFQNDEDCVDVKGKKFPAIADETGYDRRSIGQYNCYHMALSIIVGISTPQYTEKELQKIIDDNEKGFEFEGKHYTLYEGSQLQRQLETEIRKQKDLEIMAVDADNERLELESQKKIDLLLSKYSKLSRVSKLPMKLERLQIIAYNRIK